MPSNPADAPLDLAGGFPPARREEWLARVARVLARGRGEMDAPAVEAAFDRTLRTRTHEGLVLEPLYTADDAPPAGAEGLPGQPPFTRGGVAARPGAGWDVRQVVRVEGDGAFARGAAVAELEGGAVSVELDLRAAGAIDAALLDRALAGVHLDAAPVGLDAGPRWREAAAALEGLWRERAVAAPAPGGALGADPIGEHASAGGAGAPVADALADVAALAARVDGAHPGVRVVAVGAARWLEAGGSRVEELAAAMGAGVAYLRALCDAGMAPERAAAQLEFRVAADADQFTTIAALRALRRMWSRACAASGMAPEAGAARIHAVPSGAMITRHDPWVNLLRGTVACFAAGAGGADVVTVAPLDAAGGAGSPALARRMARNTQLLLIDEAGAGRVSDPAGGSWYVERLTEELARAAWSLFQEIEAGGGMVAAIESGLLRERVERVWEGRRDALAHRRDEITGVSAYPDIDEPAPAGPAPEDAVPPVGATPFPALPVRRRAEPFERLRAAADRHAAATGARPAVFLATLGTPAQHTARATFAKNLFEAAGIRALPGGDLGPGDDAGAAFAASGAALACICSSDDVYAERAADAAAGLAAAGAARVYLAGRPGGEADALRAAGVDEFAHAGVDVLDLLERALAGAGVTP